MEIRCPITRCIFRHPVVIESGVTFEKYAIMKWFCSNKTCPTTRMEITNKILFDNNVMKQFINELLVKKKISEKDIYSIDSYQELYDIIYLRYTPESKFSLMKHCLTVHELPTAENFIKVLTLYLNLHQNNVDSGKIIKTFIPKLIDLYLNRRNILPKNEERLFAIFLNNSNISKEKSLSHFIGVDRWFMFLNHHLEDICGYILILCHAYKTIYLILNIDTTINRYTSILSYASLIFLLKKLKFEILFNITIVANISLFLVQLLIIIFDLSIVLTFYLISK